jgi:ligand-binding sensor domain-containing protein/signal transduction histidine kinase
MPMKLPVNFLLILCLLFSSIISFGQQQVKFTHYTSEDGLSTNTINWVLQDKQGFIWIGTADGLNRFDGVNFKVFRHEPNNPNSLSHSNIVSLHEDEKGNIWVGTRQGLNRFDPESQSFERFLTEMSTTQNYHIILVINSDKDGNVWCGSYYGLFKLTEDTESNSWEVSRFIDDPIINNKNIQYLVWEIFEDSKGNLWFGTNYGLDLLIGDPEKDSIWIERFSHDPNDPNSISSNAVWEMDEDPWGNLWIGTRKGINRFDMKSKRFTRFVTDLKKPSSLSHNYIFSLLIEGDQLWVGTYDGGLNHTKISDNHDSLNFTHFKHRPEKPNSIAGNEVKDLWIDNSGILWIGTYSGLDKIDLNENNFNKVQANAKDATSLNSNFVQATLEDSKGTLWIGTRNGGLNYITNHDVKEKALGYKHAMNEPGNPNSLVHNDVYCLFEDSKNRLWIGTYGGISILELNKIKYDLEFINLKNTSNIKSQLTHNFVFDIVEDSDGIFWIATYGGLTRLEEKPDGSFQSRFYESNNSDTTTIINSDSYTLCLDEYDDLWIGTYAGLCVFRKDEITGKRSFTSFIYNDEIPWSLKSDEVHVLYRDSHNYIWAGTIDGLARIFVDEEKEVHFKAFSGKNGPGNQDVSDIMEDRAGNLWLTGNNGLTVFNPNLSQLSQAGNTGIIKNYDATDGLQGNEFTPRSGFKSVKGELYFGGENGFNYFDPHLIKNNPNFPPIVFTDFRLFYKSVNPGNPDYNESSPLKKSVSFTKEIELKYFQDIFSIEFIALNFTHSTKNKYKFKLEGFDPDWVYSGNENQATYTNIDPGAYTFRVMAANNDGIWNPDEASMRIIILPPPWATWWAYILYGLLSIGLIFSYNRYGVNKHKRQMAVQIRIEQAKLEEREQIRRKNAADFHDELGHNVTKISLFAEMAKRENKPGKTLQEYLDKITMNVKDLSGGIRDFIWALDPDKDSVYETLLRLQEFGDSLFEFTNVKFITRGFSGEFEEIRLVADTRRHIILIFKEAMNNCLKYANCHTAEISARLENNKLHICFRDDGIGFDKEKSKSGNGLKNMKNRAKKINAGVFIETEKEKGSVIRLELDL